MDLLVPVDGTRNVTSSPYNSELIFDDGGMKDVHSATGDSVLNWTWDLEALSH